MRFFITRLLLLTLLFLCSCSPSEVPLTHLRRSNCREERHILAELQVAPDHPLSYCEVMHLARTRNIDILVTQQENAIQRETITGQKRAMVPLMTLNASDQTRSTRAAYSSRSLANDTVTVPPSFSTERPSRMWDLSPMWSILDFGLSYYKSLQEENRLITLAQTHARKRQNLLLDVAKAYWKAMIALEAVSHAENLITRIEGYQKQLESAMADQEISQIEALDSERHIAEFKLRLYHFKYDLISAKAELSGLIGIPVGPCFELAPPVCCHCVPFNVCTLENEALYYRPELRSLDVEERIQAAEVRASIIRLFPNAQLFGGYNYDHNPLTIFNTWWTIGGRITWDLLSLPKQFATIDFADGRRNLSRASRLSMSIAVLSQVHLAYIDYLSLKKRYEYALQVANINTRLLHAARYAAELGELHYGQLLNLEIEAFLAQMDAFANYSDVQVSLERICNTIGRPLSLYRLEAHLVLQLENMPSHENL